MSKNLARMYAGALEEPLPAALQRVLEKLDPGYLGFAQAKVAAT